MRMSSGLCYAIYVACCDVTGNPTGLTHPMNHPGRERRKYERYQSDDNQVEKTHGRGSRQGGREGGMGVSHHVYHDRRQYGEWIEGGMEERPELPDIPRLSHWLFTTATKEMNQFSRVSPTFRVRNLCVRIPPGSWNWLEQWPTQILR